MAFRILNSGFIKNISFQNSLKISNFLGSVYRCNFSAKSNAVFSPALLNLPQTETSTLKNGLRVASEYWNSPTCTVGVYIDAGSRFETAANNGAAHFLEHMAFKGTSKRSQHDIELEVENRGAHLNAYTSREMTVYYAKCLSEDVPWAVEMLADILRNSKLEESQIEKERGVILREMEEVEQNLQEVVFDYLHATAYQGTPLGQTILGPEENIKTIRRDQLQNYIQNHYLAPRIVIAGAGGIEHSKLNNLANKHFGDLTDNLAAFDMPSIEQCRYTGSELRDRDDAYPLAHVAMAVQGPGWTNADTVPLMLASTLLGSWDRTQGGGANAASRLAAHAATSGDFHSFQAFNTCYSDTGLWGIYLTAGKCEVGNAMSAVVKEWIRLCTSVTDFELQRAKNALKTTLLLQLDGTTPVCEELGRHMLCYGRRIPLEEMEARIDSVDQEQMRKTLSHYIYDRCPAVASIGPTEAVTDYMVLRDKMWWTRL